MLKPLLLITTLLLSSAFTVFAQKADAEAKLRENLRATMLQLRTAETERTTLQNAKADLEARNQELSVELEKLKKEAAANQAEAARSISELYVKVDERDREIGALRVSLDKWKVDHQKITVFAQKKENARAGLADQVILLDRKVAEQRTRNAALYQVGVEILDRYEKFGLGDALTTREPFVGITRVKFASLVQDYADKLADEQLKLDPAPVIKTQTAAKKSPEEKATEKQTAP